MKTKPVTVSDHDTDLYYGSSREERVNLSGMTLRQALRALRSVDFGTRGGCRVIELSDDSYLQVANVSASDSGILIGVHEARRIYQGKVIATYPL